MPLRPIPHHQHPHDLALAALSSCALLCAVGCDATHQPAIPVAAPLSRESSVVMGQEPATPRLTQVEAVVPREELDEIERGINPILSRFAGGFSRATRFTARSIEHSETQRLAVPVEAGYCYRIVAVGTGSIEDMDMALHHASGVELESDASYGVVAILGLRQPLCFAASGTHRLDVRALAGRGSYGVEVLRAPEAANNATPWQPSFPWQSPIEMN